VDEILNFGKQEAGTPAHATTTEAARVK